MSLAVFKDNHLTVQGTKYFVANGQLVSIGSYGEKASPIFGENKLEVKDHILGAKLDGKVRTVPPITLDSTNSKKNDFTSSVSASLKVFGFSGSVSSVYDELVTTSLKLVQFWVEENDIKSAANDSPAALKNLDGYGNDARIAHQVFVIMKADWATSFTGATNLDVSGNAGIISIKASGGSAVAGKDEISLSTGTGLAYLLLKLDWDKKTGHIKDTHVDEWSLG